MKSKEGDMPSYDRIDREYKKYLKKYKYYKSIEAHIDEPSSKTEFLIKWIDAEIDVGYFSGVGRPTKPKSGE